MNSLMVLTILSTLFGEIQIMSGFLTIFFFFCPIGFWMKNFLTRTGCIFFQSRYGGIKSITTVFQKIQNARMLKISPIRCNLEFQIEIIADSRIFPNFHRIVFKHARSVFEWRIRIFWHSKTFLFFSITAIDTRWGTKLITTVFFSELIPAPILFNKVQFWIQKMFERIDYISGFLEGQNFIVVFTVTVVWKFFPVFSFHKSFHALNLVFNKFFQSFELFSYSIETFNFFLDQMNLFSVSGVQLPLRHDYEEKFIESFLFLLLDVFYPVKNVFQDEKNLRSRTLKFFYKPGGYHQMCEDFWKKEN